MSATRKIGKGLRELLSYGVSPIRGIFDRCRLVRLRKRLTTTSNVQIARNFARTDPSHVLPFAFEPLKRRIDGGGNHAKVGFSLGQLLPQRGVATRCVCVRDSYSERLHETPL